MVDVNSPNWPLQLLNRLVNEGHIQHEFDCEGLGQPEPNEDCDCIMDDLENLRYVFWRMDHEAE